MWMLKSEYSVVEAILKFPGGRLSWCTVRTFQNSAHLGAHFLKYVQGTPFDVLNGFKWFSSVHHQFQLPRTKFIHANYTLIG